MIASRLCIFVLTERARLKLRLRAEQRPLDSSHVSCPVSTAPLTSNERQLISHIHIIVRMTFENIWKMTIVPPLSTALKILFKNMTSLL